MSTERTARLLDLSKPLRLDVEELGRSRFYVKNPHRQYEPFARQRLSVFLDGEDVTKRVSAFDQEAGTVTLYVIAERAGKLTRWEIDPVTRKPLMETRTGDVSLRYTFEGGEKRFCPPPPPPLVGGTFTLDMAGRRSEPLPFDAITSEVQAAFDRLSGQATAQAWAARCAGYYAPEPEELDAMLRELGIGDSQWCDLRGPTCEDVLLRLAEEVRAGRLQVTGFREESAIRANESTITFKIRPG